MVSPGLRSWTLPGISTYHPKLGRPGIELKTSGTQDPYVNEVQQLVKYNAAPKTFTDLGQVITQFEGKTEVPPA